RALGERAGLAVECATAFVEAQHVITVVDEDGAGRAVEGVAAHPLPVPLGPVRPGIAVAVAEEELGEPLAGGGPIPPHVLARAHEIAHALLARRRDAGRRERSGAAAAAELRAG